MVRVYLGVSLDGFIAGPADDLSWLSHGAPAPDERTEALGMDAFLSQIGALLMGRRSHDVVAGMGVDWPYGDRPVLVATHRPLTPAAPTVRAVQGDIRALVAQAEAAAGGRDVYVDGGQLVRQALDADLVDELVLTVVPMLLAGGVSLFDGLTARRPLVFDPPKRYGGMVQLTARVAR